MSASKEMQEIIRANQHDDETGKDKDQLAGVLPINMINIGHNGPTNSFTPVGDLNKRNAYIDILDIFPVFVILISRFHEKNGGENESFRCLSSLLNHINQFHF